MKNKIGTREHDQLSHDAPLQHTMQFIPVEPGWEFITLDFESGLGPERPAIHRSPMIGWEHMGEFIRPLFPWGPLPIDEPIDFETEYHAFIRPNGNVITCIPYPDIWPDVSTGWPSVDEYVQDIIGIQKSIAETSGGSTQRCH